MQVIIDKNWKFKSESQKFLEQFNFPTEIKQHFYPNNQLLKITENANVHEV